MDKRMMSPNINKWIKKCIKKEFDNVIKDNLEENQDSSEIAHRIIHSKEMQVLMNSMKMAIIEHNSDSKSDNIATMESHSRSSASFVSDLTVEEWNSPKNIEDQYNYIIDKISSDKPVHVRLAGYEILLKSDLTTVTTISQWDILQNTLKDGLMGENRAIFEVSLQVYARLLSCPKAYDAYTNILSAFNAQYHTQKVHEVLPSLISGINLKFFLHEKIIRIMYLIIHYQEELLKSIRNIDKTAEEIIEQFIIFLSTHMFGNSMQIKTLSTLNIVAALDPQADWSKRWTHSFATRKTFVSILSKSPSLLKYAIQCIDKGLKKSPVYTSISICDEPIEACISGETIEIITYLHCLNFISQLCSYEAGRKLLSEISLDIPFSVTEFLITLINTLNELSSSEIASGIYNIMCQALQNVLNRPIISYDTDFYDAALYSLNNSSENDLRIWPHILYVIMHMLDTVDGSEVLINSQESKPNCTAMIIIQHISNVLKQPFSIMNTEYICNLSEVIMKLFDIFNVYKIVQDVMQNQFYPAVSHFYSKLDKYFIENGNKAQYLDNIIKKMILKIVSIPFGLQDLTSESLVFQELIRGSIAPLRNSWTSTEVVSFISSAGYFKLGREVLEDLAPHILSTLLIETCKTLEDPHCFYDPWENSIVDKFLHIIALFSLNFKCFTAFITSANEFGNNGENEIPYNLTELMQCSIKFDSVYHYLGLLSLNTIIWNLDIYIYLIEKLNFQNELLNLQNYCIFDFQIDGEVREEYIIDESSLLRHKILSNSYYIKHKYPNKVSLNEYEDTNNTFEPEEYELFSTLPPPNITTELLHEIISDSILEDILYENKSGLLDTSWISQIRNAYIDSRTSIKNAVLTTLLDQMWQAIPTAEWADYFEWPENFVYNADFFFSEELHGIDLVLQYAELNGLLQDSKSKREIFKQFLQASSIFIKYQKPNKFEGFDWFLSTVFCICEGDMDKCKIFIKKLICFPCILFIWPILGKTIDKSNNEECSTQLIFAQCLESIIQSEMPNVAYALKNTCGIDWWMLCTTILTQNFWGILSWQEIKHFFAISILYSPDYIVYYCASLIYHCRTTFIQDITNGKMWPEYMVLRDYRCHDYIIFMDKLAKRYGNKILPTITARKLYSSNETNIVK
ncbi:protein broad-minded-like [Vespula squamosa]|uniref:Protein broad-minded-like n=1 Tax=Vespula squamosa TaxID=30214 RepID=A0ABD2A7D5_VESSQ